MTTPDRLADSTRRTRQAILDGDEKRAERLQAWLNRHLQRQERFHDACDSLRDSREAKINAAIERMTSPFHRKEQRSDTAN